MLSFLALESRLWGGRCFYTALEDRNFYSSHITRYSLERKSTWNITPFEPDLDSYFCSKESLAADLSYGKIKQTNKDTNNLERPIEPFRADQVK